MSDTPEDRLDRADESGDSLEFQKALRSIAKQEYTEAKADGDSDLARHFLKQMQEANKEVIRLEGQQKGRSKEEIDEMVETIVRRRLLEERKRRTGPSDG